MKFNLVSCEIFFREMNAAIAKSPHQIEIHFLPKGLHDMPCRDMLTRVQEAVDKASHDCDAVLMGYGLCNNGINGVVSRGVQLVVPRAHDCITLFFGSKERYTDYFFNHPGVYFKTTGWIERGTAGEELKQLTIPHQMGMDKTLDEYIADYGEDNGPFLYEQLAQTSRNYGQFTFIEMGVEPDGSFEQGTRDEAAKRGWKFEKLSGSMTLIHDLLNGNWREEAFLIVPPGHRIRATHDDGIVRAEPV
jgi:hypothetical protein